MEEEWNQTNEELQTARKQVDELSLQLTVLTTGKQTTLVNSNVTKVFFMWNSISTYFSLRDSNQVWWITQEL